MKKLLFTLGILIFAFQGSIAQCPYTGNIYTECSNYPDTVYGYQGFNFDFTINSFNSPPDYSGQATVSFFTPTMELITMQTNYINLYSDQSYTISNVYMSSSYFDQGYFNEPSSTLYLKVTTSFIDNPDCDGSFPIEMSPQGPSFIWIPNPSYNDTVDASVCENETYEFGSQTLDSTGTYSELFQAQNGWDSTVVLNLTVYPSQIMYIDTAIYVGDSLFIGDSIYTESDNYQINYLNENNCDSIINLTLNVLTPFIDSSKTWSILHESYPFTHTTNYIKFNGDTTINTINYIKILRCDEENQENWYNNGFIREDMSGKVYYKDIDEDLLYDFNASINDTIFSVFFPELVVKQIDTIFFAGELRKRLLLTYGEEGSLDTNFCEKWIEGIGSLCGLLNSGQYGIVGGSTELLCYSENDILKYLNTSYTDCYIITGIKTSVLNKSQVKIYPNPAREEIYVELTPTNSVHKKGYCIFTIDGKKVLEGKLQNEKTRISTKNLESGIYFIRIDESVSKIIITN